MSRGRVYGFLFSFNGTIKPGSFERKTPHWKPERRWDGNIKIVRNEVGCVTGDHCRTLVHTAMN
jgi:hypothetical protein